MMKKWNRFEIEYDFVNDAILKFIVRDTKEQEGEDTYLKAEIKYSGCSHFWFGNGEKENPGYLHICMYEDFLTHTQLLKQLYTIAREEFEKKGNLFWGMIEWNADDEQFVENGGQFDSFGNRIEAEEEQ